MSWGKVISFAGGVLFGTAGIRVLSSRDAKKAYVHCTAAVLRAKDEVEECATTIQENCMDIYEEAMAINEERRESEKEEIIEDAKEAKEENAETVK